MILSGNTTLRRNFIKQEVPYYLPPLNFSFELEAQNIGSSLDFGVGAQNGVSFYEYNLRSGVIANSGRAIGTYQSGTNNFFFNATSGSLIFKVNDQLVLNDDFNAVGNPFAQFYIKNYDSAPVDFSLNINGYSPPTDVLALGTNDNLLTLEGYLRQSGYYDYPFDLTTYQVFGISVPPEYGAVNYFDLSGVGQIRYTLSGASYSFGDIIPVTFDTYFGEFTSNVEVTGAGGSTGIPESGIYLNLYGVDNLMVGTNLLNFNLDYYSNKENDVSIELEVEQSYRSVVLSGSGAGGVTYQGFVNGSGTIFSDGNLTGVADLQAPENALYNTEYAVLDRYLNITKPGYFEKETYFIGENTFNYTGIVLTGTYDGPNSSYIGKTWIAKGFVNIPYDFTAGDLGVVSFNDIFPGTGLAEYNSTFKMASLGGGYLDYPSDPSIFPTGIGYGEVVADATGQGTVTVFDAYSFFGSGIGRVATGSLRLPATGTGNYVYRGSVERRTPYAAYAGDKPVFTDRPGELVECSGLYKYGTTMYNGKLSTITDVFSDANKTWGVGSGPTELIFGGGGASIQSYFNLPAITGIGASGDEQVRAVSGFFTGTFVYPTFTIAGPVFGGPRDTTLRPYNGGNGLFAASTGSVYGRSCIFSNGLYFTPNSVDIAQEMLDNPPEVVYNIQEPGFQGVYTNPLTGEYFSGGEVPMFIGDLASNEYSQPYVNFLNPIIYPETGQFEFTGYAQVAVDTNLDLFNLYEVTDPEGTYYNYKAEGWIAGNSLKRPVPETFPATSASRYLRVEYAAENADSVGTATLRVQGGGETLEVLITGNSDGVR